MENLFQLLSTNYSFPLNYFYKNIDIQSLGKKGLNVYCRKIVWGFLFVKTGLDIKFKTIMELLNL